MGAADGKVADRRNLMFDPEQHLGIWAYCLAAAVGRVPEADKEVPFFLWYAGVFYMMSAKNKFRKLNAFHTA
jgi:hypothetical protein